MVSSTGTYLPSSPVNCTATENGCDRNLCTLRARLTTSLSSSDNSSIPRIAMISCSSLYFCKISCTPRATLKCSSPTILGSRIREVEASGSTAGYIPSSTMERSSTVVASRCANVVAGAGSVRSSAGTYTACTEVIDPFFVDVIRSCSAPISVCKVG